jgi:photosystem II stability/assembly factor-like uncharacterized protein
MVASQGYTGAQVRGVAVDPNASGRVFAAARSGLFVSNDAGDDWNGLNTPPAFVMEWYTVAIDPVNSSHLLAANNWNGVILQSHDAGQTWHPTSHRPGDTMSWRAIAFTPSDPEIVYAGTSAFYSAGTFDERLPAAGIYVSHDGGSSWSEANDALSEDANVTSLAVHPGDSRVVYAATGNHGLLKSTDGGESWTAINQGLPGSPTALSVVVHPQEPDVIYAGLAFAGLYRSQDGGATWLPAAAGLNPEASVSDIVFDPTDPRLMYAADRLSGVYRSSDGGPWVPTSYGLRTRAVNALAISSDGQHLYAATDGEGVFRLDLSGEPPQPVPTPTPIPPTAVSTSTPAATPVPAIPTPVEDPSPTALAVAPTSTPMPRQPTETAPAPTQQPAVTPEPAPSRGGRLCGGVAALPLAWVGLIWVSRRR